MNAVWFILVIALLNTVFGFAIAVHLGRRYRTTVPPDWDFGEDMSWADVQGDASDTKPDQSVAERDLQEEGDAESTISEEEERLSLPDEQVTATALDDEAREVPRDREEAATSEPIPGGPTEELSAKPEPANTGPESREAEVSEEMAAESEVSSELSDEAEPGEPRSFEAVSEEDVEAEHESPEMARADDSNLETRVQTNTSTQADVDAAEKHRATESSDVSEAEEKAAAAKDMGIESGNDIASQPAAKSERLSGGTGTGTAPEEALGAEERPATNAQVNAAAEQAEVADEEREGPHEQPHGTAEGADTPAVREIAELQQRPQRSESNSDSDKAIADFLAEVEQYQEQLGQADTQLRAQAEDPDSNSIRECLASLLEASREFAQQREHARTGLEGLTGETAEFEGASERLKGAIVQQDAQIESTERAVTAFPYVDDLSQGCRVMIGETTKLMDANVRVRDSLQEVGLQLARGEHRLTDLEPARKTDALTGTESRESLEGALLQWMHGGEEAVDTLSVAVLDVDAFGQVNEEYGHSVGNELLHALGKLLLAENGGHVRLARFSGERFALLFPNVDLRAAANAVERLRQIVELSRFEYKNSEIQITISCGVAESLCEDTPDTVMIRAEATLMEAKRYGRNRTFIHEGKYPTPVVPPTFALEPRRMRL